MKSSGQNEYAKEFDMLADMGKPAHYCPDWDEDWITSNTPEMDCCTCSFKKDNE